MIKRKQVTCLAVSSQPSTAPTTSVLFSSYKSNNRKRVKYRAILTSPIILVCSTGEYMTLGQNGTRDAKIFEIYHLSYYKKKCVWEMIKKNCLTKILVNDSNCLFWMNEYTGFIVQYLKPKHVITRIFHVFLHEKIPWKSLIVYNTFFDVSTFCNYHYKQNVVKLISRE